MRVRKIANLQIWWHGRSYLNHQDIAQNPTDLFLKPNLALGSKNPQNLMRPNSYIYISIHFHTENAQHDYYHYLIV